MDDTHIRFFTKKSFYRLFHKQGYEIVDFEGINPCKSRKEKMFILLYCDFLKDSRFKQFAVVAKPFVL